MPITFLKPKATDVKGLDAYSVHLSSTPITGSTTTSKTKAKAPEVLVGHKDETINPGVIIPESALYLVTVEGGSTINLGNYESARIHVSLRVPTTKDDLNASYDWAVTWVGERIEAAIKDAKGL